MAPVLKPDPEVTTASALSGVRIVYLAAPGPVPFAAMLLGDLGADVIRIDQAGAPPELTGLRLEDDPRTRGQRGIGLNLKLTAARTIARQLAATADVFLEGMRPGVAERLELGPDDLAAGNPGLVYGRMTGWGRSGPLASRAGHDINYLAMAGALHPIGPREGTPAVPLNLLADFGGGGTYLAIGVLAALYQRRGTGRGQVVDAAMVDGVASLTSLIHGMLGAGLWRDERQANLLDGGAPFYRTYQTSDDRFVAVGAIEAKFYRQLLTGLGLDAGEWPQHDRTRWPALGARLAAIFALNTRDYWVEKFRDVDACLSPVLSLAEAASAPELRERGTFVEEAGLAFPAAAPRLSASPVQYRARSAWCSHTGALLGELSYSEREIECLRADGAIS